MPRTITKSREHPNDHEPNIKQEINNTKSNLSPNFQYFKQKLLSGHGFLVYKGAHKILK